LATKNTDPSDGPQPKIFGASDGTADDKRIASEYNRLEPFKAYY
jgi:hypothetical protein